MAATANLKSTISLDATAFSAGVRRVKLAAGQTATAVAASFRRIGSSIAQIAGRLAKFASIAAGITFAAAIGGAYKLAGALRKAFDAGGALSDLSAQTGIAVKELAILQRAFEDNGVSGEQVGTVVNKLQRSISDFGNGLSTQTRAFERLGLSYEQLETLSPLEQFQAVQRALSNMENPTQRAATAMEIFGRSGGQLLTLFADGGAIEKASVTLGGSADLLERNASTFDRISDLLNSASTKIQGFFVGVADVAAPKILEALERFNSIDFASIGQRFTAGLDLESALSLLKSTFAIAAGFLGNQTIRAMLIAGEVIAAVWSDKLSTVVENFKSGMLDAAKGLFNPLEFIKGMKGAADTLSKSGAGGIGESIGETISKAIDKVGAGGDIFGVEGSLADLKATLKGVMDQGTAQAAVTNSIANQKDIFDKAFGDTAGKTIGEAAVKAATTAHHGTDKSEPQSNPFRFTGAALHDLPGLGSLLDGGKGMGAFDKLRAQKLAGVAVGTTGAFANDRQRLGIASGLQTGGLGAVSAVGRANAAQSARTGETLADTNSNLQELITATGETNEILRQGLE